MTAIETTTLPLNQLRVDDKANVRKIGRGADPVLLASIKAHGLLNPLRVRANGKGYTVIAGGQRLECLKAMHADGGLIPADHPIPVIIVTDDDAAAREKSLAENVARSAMHPVDEFRAYHDLHTDKANPLTVEQIAQRFGVTIRTVMQRLALGDLDASVLKAWQDGQLDGRTAKLFTMQSSKKAQKAALEKLSEGYFNDYEVRQALGLTSDRHAGKLLALVGEDAYIARGGKITQDLFAEANRDETQISDPALLNAMAGELVEVEIARLTSEGWGSVLSAKPNNYWNYPTIKAEGKPTKEEAARLKEIDAAYEAAEEADDDEGTEALEAERDAINDAVEARALSTLDAKKKANCIVWVEISNGRIEIEYRAQQASGGTSASSSSSSSAAKATAAKKVAPEDAISQALLVRQAQQLSAAASVAVLKQSNVALAIVIASLTSSTEAVTIRGDFDHKAASFTTTLAGALKLTQGEQIALLTKLAGKNLKLWMHTMKEPALAGADIKAIANAIDGKALTVAVREKFDAKDFFASVSRSTIVEAVREAMGDDHARNVGAMKKDEAAKFATANLPKTKWLPKQLRVAGYDGPAKKVAAKKPTAKKAAAKKAKR